MYERGIEAGGFASGLFHLACNIRLHTGLAFLNRVRRGGKSWQHGQLRNVDLNSGQLGLNLLCSIREGTVGFEFELRNEVSSH